MFQKKYTCSIVDCLAAYTNVTHLRRHYKTAHADQKPEGKIPCKECGEKFSSEATMQKHLINFHVIGKKRYICSICQDNFPRKQMLKRHMIIHTGNYPYRCESCGKGSMNLRAHIKHRASHSHICEQCGKTYKNWTGLVAHRKVDHTVEHKCLVCEKLFHSKSNLKHHQKVHMNKDDRPILECPYDKCSKHYFEKKNLDAHIRSKHEGRKFICGYEDCRRPMSTKQKLLEHIKLHLAERDGVKSRPVSRRSSVDSERRPRKDKGKKKEAAATILSGVEIPREIEKALLDNKGDQILVLDEILTAEIPISDTD